MDRCQTLQLCSLDRICAANKSIWTLIKFSSTLLTSLEFINHNYCKNLWKQLCCLHLTYPHVNHLFTLVSARHWTFWCVSTYLCIVKRLDHIASTDQYHYLNLALLLLSVWAQLPPSPNWLACNTWRIVDQNSTRGSTPEAGTALDSGTCHAEPS